MSTAKKLIKLVRVNPFRGVEHEKEPQPHQKRRFRQECRNLNQLTLIYKTYLDLKMNPAQPTAQKFLLRRVAEADVYVTCTLQAIEYFEQIGGAALLVYGFSG